MQRIYTLEVGAELAKKIILHNKSEAIDQLELRTFILLYNQSTLDLICKKNLTSGVSKARRKISVQGNGGTLMVHKKAKLPRYV